MVRTKTRTLKYREEYQTGGLKDPDLDAHRRQFLGKPGSLTWNEYHAGLVEARQRLFGGYRPTRKSRNERSRVQVQYGGKPTWLGVTFEEPDMFKVLKFVQEENAKVDGADASRTPSKEDKDDGEQYVFNELKLTNTNLPIQVVNYMKNINFGIKTVTRYSNEEYAKFKEFVRIFELNEQFDTILRIRTELEEQLPGINPEPSAASPTIPAGPAEFLKDNEQRFRDILDAYKDIVKRFQVAESNMLKFIEKIGYKLDNSTTFKADSATDLLSGKTPPTDVGDVKDMKTAATYLLNALLTQFNSIFQAINIGNRITPTNMTIPKIRDYIVQYNMLINESPGFLTLSILKDWAEQLANFIKSPASDIKPTTQKVRKVTDDYLPLDSRPESFDNRNNFLKLPNVSGGVINEQFIYILDAMHYPWLNDALKHVNAGNGYEIPDDSSTSPRKPYENASELVFDNFAHKLIMSTSTNPITTAISEVVGKLAPTLNTVINEDIIDKYPYNPPLNTLEKIQLKWSKTDVTQDKLLQGINNATTGAEKTKLTKSFFDKPGGIIAEDIKIHLIPFFFRVYMRLIMRMKEDYSASKQETDSERAEDLEKSASKKRELVTFLIRILRDMNMYVNPVFLDDLYYYYYVLGLDKFTPSLDFLFRFGESPEEPPEKEKEVGTRVTMSAYPIAPDDKNSEKIAYDYAIRTENIGKPHKLWFDYWLNMVKLNPENLQTETQRIQRDFIFEPLNPINDKSAEAGKNMPIYMTTVPTKLKKGGDASEKQEPPEKDTKVNLSDNESETDEQDQHTDNVGVTQNSVASLSEAVRHSAYEDSNSPLRRMSRPLCASGAPGQLQYQYLPDSILHRSFEECVQLGDTMPEIPYTIHIVLFSLDWSCYFDEQNGPSPFLKFLVEKSGFAFPTFEYSCAGDTEENERRFKCELYDRVLETLRLSIAQSSSDDSVVDKDDSTVDKSVVDDSTKDKCERMEAALESFYRGLVSDGNTTVLAMFDYDALDRVVGKKEGALFVRHDDTIYPITDENVGSSLQWALVDELVFNKQILTTPVNHEISKLLTKHENLWNISDKHGVYVDFPFAVYNLEESGVELPADVNPPDAPEPEPDPDDDDDDDAAIKVPSLESQPSSDSPKLFYSVTVSPIYDKEGASMREQTFTPTVILNNYGKEDEYDSRYCFTQKPIIDETRQKEYGQAKRYAMFAWKPRYILDDDVKQNPSTPTPLTAPQEQTQAEAEDSSSRVNEQEESEIALEKLEFPTIYFQHKQNDQTIVVWGIRNNNQFSAL